MLTLLIALRNWDQDRLDACVASFLAMKAKSITEILIVDFGSAEPVQIPDHPMVRGIYLQSNIWSLAEAVNAGVLSARNAIIAKCDADMLIAPWSALTFDLMAERIGKSEIGIAIAQAVDLPPELSVAEAAALVAEGKRNLGRYREKWGQGGLVMFSSQVWSAIGGMESRFVGWGNEDNNFAERIRFAGFPLHWIDGQTLAVHHIWHPPSHAARGVLAQRAANQKLEDTDKSIFRSPLFRNSNFLQIAAPNVQRSVSPLVTLAIATTERPYRDRMIVEAINSFRGQIDNDFEVVVLDNGSSDEGRSQLSKTLSRLKWFPRLRLEHVARNSISAARNMITDMAEGRYICVVDDDDLALPTRLHDHLAPFKTNRGMHGTHGGWIDFDEETGVIERNSGKTRNLATLLKGTGKITAHPASFYRTDVLRACPYDESFDLGSDLDLAIRLALASFEIGHTGSFVTLRRFHSSNVTLTGMPNQISNGARSRKRALATFTSDRTKQISALAKKSDAEVWCRNTMSFETLMAHLPPYIGSWQLMVSLDIIVKLASNTDTADKANEFFQKLPGYLGTERSGRNQPVVLRSMPIKGLRKAAKIKQEIEIFLGCPVQMISKKQAELDRGVAYNWAELKTESGCRLLRSPPFVDYGEVQVAVSKVPAESALRATLWILSDWQDGGERHYIMSAQIKGFDALKRTAFELQGLTGLRFEQIASSGLVCDLTRSPRSH